MATLPIESPLPKMYCGECGGAYAANELERFGNHFVCVNCKPGYLLRVHSAPHPVRTALSGVRYGGFWIRAVALFIDGLILSAFTAPLFLLLVLAGSRFEDLEPPNPSIALVGVLYLFLFALTFVYNVWFVSQKGGTLGKLIAGLRVVTPDGRNLSVGLAVGRYFAVLLSHFTFYIGFIIAAFDSEKRALHDHICNTRVIRK